MVAPIVRNAGVEDLVVAALDHVNGIDLHVAEMLHGSGCRGRPCAERRWLIEALRAQPDAAGAGIGKGDGGRLHATPRSSRQKRQPRSWPWIAACAGMNGELFPLSSPSSAAAALPALSVLAKPPRSRVRVFG